MTGQSVTTLGSWHAEGTTIGAVETAIADLRRQEEKAAVRTAVLTLVVLVDADACNGAREVLRELGSRHPSHGLLLVTGRRDGESRFNADVQVHVLEQGDRALSFEDVVLWVDGPAVDHLDSIIEPFSLPDLPIVVWLPDRLPALHDPVLGSADRVVVDSKAVGEDAAFADLGTLIRRCPVADLSWVRLAPWRELLAGLFEGAAFRPFLDDVRGVTVAGKRGPRHLLAGWLASRLDLPRSRLRLVDAQHVTLEIDAAHDGRAGRFVVGRRHGERLVDATATVDDGPSHARTLRLRERSPARVLGQALGRLGHDDVYDQALTSALELL